MNAWRWDKEKKEYGIVQIPDGSCSYCDDMNETVSCAHCGKKLKYGESYTSLELYGASRMFGLAVCGDCYEKEDR